MSISLAAEFIVSGMIPFLAISFAILSIIHVYDLSFLSQAKDFSGLLVIFAALSMYLLGALIHRLNDLINTRSMKRLLALRPLRNTLEPSTPTDLEEWTEWVVRILQSGSERLNDDVANDWSLLRIFKSTALTAPVLAFALAWWLHDWAGWRCALVAFFVCVSLAAAAFESFVIQRRGHWRKVEVAVELLGKSENAELWPVNALSYDICQVLTGLHRRILE